MPYCQALVFRVRWLVMPGKSYTIHDLKEPAEGWAYFERLLRHRVSYKVDMVNLALVTGAETPDQIKKQCIAIMKHQTEGWAMSYGDIYLLAQKYRTVPEFLVDEAYYRGKSGILGYRLAFSVLRKGGNLWDLYVSTLAAGWKLSPWTFYSMVMGKKQTYRYVDLDTVRGICELAGIELADLFAPRFRARVVSPTLAAMTALVGMLDDASIAALVGIAAALAKHKDTAPALAEIGRVLEWREKVQEHAVDEQKATATGPDL